jgi:hypothetical protein
VTSVGTRGCPFCGTSSTGVEVTVFEASILSVEDDGSALASLVLTLRLASSNLVRAAERVIDPGCQASQMTLLISAHMDDLARSIEHVLLHGPLDDALR